MRTFYNQILVIPQYSRLLSILLHSLRNKDANLNHWAIQLVPVGENFLVSGTLFIKVQHGALYESST